MTTTPACDSARMIAEAAVQAYMHDAGRASMPCSEFDAMVRSIAPYFDAMHVKLADRHCDMDHSAIAEITAEASRWRPRRQGGYGIGC